MERSITLAAQMSTPCLCLYLGGPRARLVRDLECRLEGTTSWGRAEAHVSQTVGARTQGWPDPAWVRMLTSGKLGEGAGVTGPGVMTAHHVRSGRPGVGVHG